MYRPTKRLTLAQSQIRLLKSRSTWPNQTISLHNVSLFTFQFFDFGPIELSTLIA